MAETTTMALPVDAARWIGSFDRDTGDVALEEEMGGEAIVTLNAVRAMLVKEEGGPRGRPDG